MTVCLVHAYELSGFYQLGRVAAFLSSEVAVKAFFVVSGFLIIMSYERSTSLLSYAEKRVRRIYPAYFTVVMICAIGLVAVSSKNSAHYFSFAWLKYVTANLSFLNFLEPKLPGVFLANKLSVVNGALWTLKVEAMFYLAVPLLVFLFRRFSRMKILVLVYCLSVTYSELLQIAFERTGVSLYEQLSRQLPGQLSYFMAGAFLYYYLPFFERRIGYFITVAAAVLTVNIFLPLSPLEPFALAVMVIFFGLFLYMGNFGKYGDFSYGIYILHFPIIQLLLYSGWFNGRPWPFLVAVVCCTIISAIIMWHLVEKTFLLRSSHYIDATSSPEVNISKKTERNLCC